MFDRLASNCQSRYMHAECHREQLQRRWLVLAQLALARLVVGIRLPRTLAIGLDLFLDAASGGVFKRAGGRFGATEG